MCHSLLIGSILPRKRSTPDDAFGAIYEEQRRAYTADFKNKRDEIERQYKNFWHDEAAQWDVAAYLHHQADHSFANVSKWVQARTVFTNPSDPKLAETPQCFIIGVKASFDVAQYSERPGTAAMSMVHLLALSKARLYNGVSLSRSDVNILDDMISLFKISWPDVKFREAVLHHQVSAIKSQYRSKSCPSRADERALQLALQHAKELKNRIDRLGVNDFQFGLHLYPDQSVSHLHMHIIAMPWQMRKYSTTEHDGKTKDALEVRDVISSVLRHPMQLAVEQRAESLFNKIDSLPLSLDRRRVFKSKVLALLGKLENLTLVPTAYIMEGATSAGDESRGSRKSTDPDENMALYVIAKLTVLHNQRATLPVPAIIAVPDESCRAHTSALLQDLGFAVAEEHAKGIPHPDLFYITRMDSKTEMQWAKHHVNRIAVLGPPTGQSEHLLLDSDQKVIIMGSVELRDGIVHGHSTNTRDPESVAFFYDALSRQNPQQMPSKYMGKDLTICLHELRLGCPLPSARDDLHWLSNTIRQMTGRAPWHLLTKRLLQSGAADLFSDERTITLDETRRCSRPRRLAFLPLLNNVRWAALQPEALAMACKQLGSGYTFLLESHGGEKAREHLRAIVASHQNDLKCLESERSSDVGYEDCLAAIERLSSQQAAYAFAAICLAFQDIYAEKTVDGWSQAGEEQWRAQKFEEAYRAGGKQLFYDAYVVLEPLFGVGESSEEKREMAIMLVLLCYMDTRLEGS